MTQVHMMSCDYAPARCKEQINKWIALHPGIKVIDVKTDQHTGGMYSHQYWTNVTIIYEGPEVVTERGKLPPRDLWAPPPPAPPLTEMETSFFGSEKETEHSKIRKAYFKGMSFMWDQWNRALNEVEGKSNE